ncbi:hypothetical protein T440DRAFT_412218 [Plenodomus tracheiphilus IPT5]|uniref:AA1-like domain-containing protein n=1 Tax=Plenodomus tracheiphilus IPT5 TaxID=1408161 RepID=A0A6A7BN66_9PLEO|nr:hypothetical protein T440DRAFT_412218 [Plenodomus tracheiphilus IPT5]
MQFITLAAALFGAAIAAPAPQTSDCPNPAHCGEPPAPGTYENIDISEYTLRKNNGTVQAVSFKLSGDDAKDLLCETGAVPTLPSEVVTCGDSKYRFGLVASPTEGDVNPGLAVYHETGIASGKFAIAQGPNVYCHAGGNGPQDFVCQQVDFYTVVITNGST